MRINCIFWCSVAPLGVELHLNQKFVKVKTMEMIFEYTFISEEDIFKKCQQRMAKWDSFCSKIFEFERCLNSGNINQKYIVECLWKLIH